MKSFISWIGGKNLLKKEIVSRFPNESFDPYIEVFGGAAWVLFHKDRRAETEIYNDLDGDLVNLFRCVKYHCSELQRELRFVLNSRELFEGFKNENPLYLTDIQRAARFFMLIKISYGSRGGTFGCIKKDISSMLSYLTAIEERLKNVVIEHKDFEDLINNYSRKNALFYLDPPYYGTEKYYTAAFLQADHIRLKSCLENIKSKFILTYNNCDYIKNIYGNFNIVEVERFNNLSTTQGGNYYKELIITNY